MLLPSSQIPMQTSLPLRLKPPCHQLTKDNWAPSSGRVGGTDLAPSPQTLAGRSFQVASATHHRFPCPGSSVACLCLLGPVARRGGSAGQAPSPGFRASQPVSHNKLAPAFGPEHHSQPPCRQAPHSQRLLPGFGMSPWKGLEEKQRGECQGEGLGTH